MMGENLQIVNDSLDIWESQAKDRKVTIAFACSIEHGEALYKEASNRGISAVLIHSKTATNRHEKEQILKDIKEARYSLIININMLTTGFDAPIVDCVLLLRPTLSAQLFVQMCLDTETEILTSRGWAKHDDISYDDTVITYDIKSGEARKSPVKNIIHRPVADGEKFVSIESKRSNFKVTGNHDLITRNKRSKRKW